MPVFRTMRERVEYAYDELNVDIYYEGEDCFTIHNHTKDEYVERLTERELDKELARIWATIYSKKIVVGASL